MSRPRCGCIPPAHLLSVHRRAPSARLCHSGVDCTPSAPTHPASCGDTLSRAHPVLHLCIRRRRCATTCTGQPGSVLCVHHLPNHCLVLVIGSWAPPRDRHACTCRRRTWTTPPARVKRRTYKPKHKQQIKNEYPHTPTQTTHIPSSCTSRERCS